MLWKERLRDEIFVGEMFFILDMLLEIERRIGALGETLQNCRK